MGLVAVQGSDFIQFHKFAIDTHLRISSLAHLLEELLVMALAALYYRRQEIASAARIILHYERDYLFVAVADHRPAGLRRIGGRRPRIKKTQEVVYFSYGSDGRARIVSRCLLLYGDYRAEACDGLDFRLFQNAHEMLGICGQCIHIPALAFSIYGVECKGGLSAAAESGHDDKAVARNRQRRTLEVMGFRSPYLYIILLLVHKNTNI